MARFRWSRVLWIVLALFVVIQLVPYGHDRTNPPVVAEPKWPSSEARALAVRACYDCHSNETRWPWYSRVAPASWLLASDVGEGRETLNFSAWRVPDAKDRDQVDKVVRDGDMPPWYYAMMHRESRLTDAERKTLADALIVMVGRMP